MNRMRNPSLVAIGLLGLLGMSHAQADPQWVKLKTDRYTLNIKQDAISFIDDKRGWYGNGLGRIYRTVDGGTRWTKIWEKRGTYVRALEFADENLGFLGNVGPGYFPDVKDTQPIYVTRDGGSTWEPVKAIGQPVTGICAIDVLKIDGQIAAIRAGGRVGGPAAMMESFDAGQTWQSRDMSSVTGMILDIKFIDAMTGFIAGATDPEEPKAHARILKTSDGGKTWRAVFESDRAVDNNWKLAFPSARVGYATIMSYDAPPADARGYVAKTEDGGETWTKRIVTQDSEWIPYGISFIDEQHGFVGGSTGGYETKDGGATWKAVKMGTYVNKIRFTTRSDGGITAFAIGQDVFKLDLPPSQPLSRPSPR
jgi:photosystem II stability/assembly factor-like uncharacterized protein